MDKCVVFMGSPSFALPTLCALHRHFRVAGVITQPDRPAGRGRSLVSSPVKSLALELGLPFIQPSRLRDPGALEQLAAWAPDLIVVAAFGQILRREVLDLPPHGCLNVHASLLPWWRGASPVHHAILHGDAKTGVTIMRMDAGLDTGPILSQSVTPILQDDTAESLSQRLGNLGAELLVETLPGYLIGKILPQAQDSNQSTYAPLLKKQDGAMDFSRTAVELERQVRAFYPWPGAFLEAPGGMLKVHKARVEKGSAQPGKHLTFDGFPCVGTAAGLLVLEIVQPSGRSVMPGDIYQRGVRGWGDSERRHGS